MAFGMSDPWVLAHDFCFDFAGAERVASAIAELENVKRLIYVAGRAETANQVSHKPSEFLLTSSLLTQRNYRSLAPFALLATRTARPISENLISSSYGFSHWLRSEKKKIVYCHTPFRQAWSGLEMYLQDMSPSKQFLWKYFGSSAYRALDKNIAREASTWVAPSAQVQQRLKDSFGVDSIKISPPINDLFFRSNAKEDYYLWAGRIVEPYKRLSLVVETFKSLPRRRLVVAGTGPALESIRSRAPGNVTFLGNQDTEELAVLYSKARAVIFPSEDDFGLVPVEAMASGTPTIALAAGGALETVVDGITGVFFTDTTTAGLLKAIQTFEEQEFSQVTLVKMAEHFSQVSFQKSIDNLLK
jgi:glycosyltransferase involved in cell wall biosynthesis